MNRARRVTGILVAMLGFNLAAGVGAADTFRVAVIDPQAVLERSKSGKRALESLKAFSASRQRIVREEDEELKRLEKELQAGTSGEKDTVRKDKEEHFRAKLERYQRRVQAFNREIRDKQQELVQAFQKNIEHVAATVAAKAGYAAVLNKGALNSVRIVLYHRHAVDLTDEVLKEFDRLYS